MDIYRASAPRVPTGSPRVQTRAQRVPPALPLAPEAPAAARDPAIVAPPPGRAARMLPDRVQLGSALVAATARALGAFQGPSDPEDSESSDGGAPDDDTASSMDDDAATSSSDDDRLGHVATELPARAGYTAVAAAPTMGCHDTASEAVSTAAIVYVSRTCDDRLGRQAPILPDRVGCDAPMPCGDEPSAVAGPCPHDDDCTPGRAGSMLPVGAAQAPATTAAVPMEVDQGATWQAASLTPPSPPLVLRLNGKRRRLNDEDDGEEREQAEQLLLEDVEAGPMNSALWPSTASALPASVLAVYAHNAQRFTCTLCAYTASSFASLKRHRDSRHRRISFLDRFSAGCACGTPFVSRLAAANHAQACASLRDTSAATASAAGDLSPTAGAVNATATVADTEPVLPRQDPPVLTVSPPQSSTTHDRSTESRWSPPLPRQLVASRVASRLSEVPAPRWGPPLPRSVVVSRIADRLLPPELTEEEETKAGDSDDEDVNDDPDMDGEWLLRFDGACRANPGPGGAGAALFKPSGPVVWTCSHYMPSSGETNNTAEYTALLLGTRAAADHGVTRLRIEGDSTLVIQQVRGIFATRNKRLRQLRIAVKAELARMERATLHPIDRQANGHADRLANAALDRRTTTLECGVHTDGHGCTSTSTTAPAPAAAPPPATPHVAVGTDDPPSPADDDDMGDIDDGEVYAAMSVGPDAVPQRRSRLRLRQLNEDEEEAAGKLVERLAAKLAAKITDGDDWEEAEGYITALPYALYDQLQPYSQTQHPAQPHSQRPQLHHPDVRPARRPEPHQGPAQAMTLDGQRQGGSRSRRRRGHSGGGMGRRRTRPPRVTRHHREHRLDEALDAMHAVQRSEPGNRKVVAKARRRVGRINSSISQQRLRHLFETSEKVCVESILATARSKREADEAAATPASTSAPPPDCVDVEEGTCPIPGESLHRFFTEVNSPVGAFDPMAPVGASFRAAMDRLPPATVDMALLTDGPSSHEIEDQVQRARGSSSPGLDGVGYDIFKLFTAQLLPALHAAFARCWQSKRVPQSWKVGVVRLLHKKGDRLDPSNWRPICLQQAIYKLYAGVLSRRFTRWLDVNGRHADAQKGFRAMNGCGEHNFLAAMLVDQARRKHQELHVVWYDFANAFGSVPHDLLWEALQRQGVPPEFVACCRGIYADAAFTIGNAVDETTAPIALKVGVFQGCPLSTHLFTAAIAPLLHALKSLPDTGVKMSCDDRPGAAAYADDLKTFSSTVDGIQRQHSVVHDFLRWTGMKANSLKCSTMSVQRDVRGLHQTSDLGLQLNGTPIPALSASDSYQYLGIGDGFDHVGRRVELGPAIAQLKHDATALLQSGLAPWQVVKAVKVYLYPRVEYALRHLRPFAQQLEGFDRHLARGLRHLLRLPTSATTAFLYAPVSRGGLGLLPLTELHGALQVAHGWQMLHSSDPSTQRIARQQLRQIAEARYKLDVVLWKDREEELGELLLNSKLGASDPAPPKRRNADIGSLWFDVRGHLHRFGLKFEMAPAVEETGTPAKRLQLRVPHHDGWLDHRDVLRHVKLHLKNKHWKRWAAMTDQGKAARTLGGAGSAFLSRPRGLWESDYRFAVGGRLNQLDTHSVLKRRRLRTHDKCRFPGCSRTETLAHVLNHCAGTMDAVRTRHDDALTIIERAIASSAGDRKERVELRVNQTVPSLPVPALRPDLQVYNHTTRSVSVVDLAVAFEDQATDDPRTSSLARIAALKRAKYDCVKRHLERQGWTVHLSSLVYGSLDAVAGGNLAVYTEQLGVLKRDAKRLDRHLSAECIKSSRRIWNLHCSQHRARQQGQGEVQGSSRDQAQGRRHGRSRRDARGSRVTETGGTPSHQGHR
uniref:Reverse transcriptase n=1 Tax=Peronospora matthiolae TaxID=2874970 RepID=A0AAV1VNW4_9STRA